MKGIVIRETITRRNELAPHMYEENCRDMSDAVLKWAHWCDGAICAWGDESDGAIIEWGKYSLSIKSGDESTIIEILL